MKLTFEIHTTSSRPIYLSIDHDITLKQFYDELTMDIDHYTMLSKGDILDVFATKPASSQVLSIPIRSADKIQEFIELNREYFPESSLIPNFYKVYIIDNVYRNRTKNGLPTPVYTGVKNEIQPNHWNDLLQITKKIIFL